ncbi:hypothetical protein HAX54_015177 [Datura stramonium]|uniref:Uncharacterized protein n=1 Tax=Datura stramonium TaxID=4076 RepID=A0ABS8TP58_DATST|nr:hypothetical protein [Datura stramonium]
MRDEALITLSLHLGAPIPVGDESCIVGVTSEEIVMLSLDSVEARVTQLERGSGQEVRNLKDDLEETSPFPRRKLHSQYFNTQDLTTEGAPPELLLLVIHHLEAQPLHKLQAIKILDAKLESLAYLRIQAHIYKEAGTSAIDIPTIPTIVLDILTHGSD